VFYEIIAVPGDRVVLQNGKLTVNGKQVQSALLDLYEEKGVTIAGGYDQLLNAREYLLLNHFPQENSLQPATINAVHKILGKVVGLAQRGVTETIYFDESLTQANYAPEQYFDLMLYDLIFGEGNIAQTLTVDGATFTVPTRASAYFLEEDYREVKYINNNEVEIRYSYGGNPNPTQTFKMYKQENSTVWRWGL
jgi:signal peptidase I